jgi:ribosomal protein S18 acetylase RimI-like enzyme
MYTRLQPVLHVADLAAEVAFYSALGFDVELEPAGESGFAAMTYGGGALNSAAAAVSGAAASSGAAILFGLQSAPGLAGPPPSLAWGIGVESVADVAALCSRHGLPVVQAPRQESWGEWTLAVRSPNGYRVTFEGPYGHTADDVIDGVRYTASLRGITADHLSGFFVGWPQPPSPETHLRILAGSDHVLLAIDDASGQVIGFINALSDGTLSAFIPLLEVLPEYQGRGIGSELVRRMLARLEGLYGVDLVCDDDLRPFYERFDMFAVTGMVLRRQQPPQPI